MFIPYSISKRTGSQQDYINSKYSLKRQLIYTHTCICARTHARTQHTHTPHNQDV